MTLLGNLYSLGSDKISQNVCLTCGLMLGITLGYVSINGRKLLSKLGQTSPIRSSSAKKFDCMVDPNFKMSEANFTYDFQNLSTMRKAQKDSFSPTIWIGDLPWKIMLRPTKLCLEAHVICSELYCSWSCCVHLEFSLVGKKTRVLAVDNELYEADSQNEYNRNMGQDIPWEEILDPGNAYIHDDSITFHVILKVEILEKISWSDKMYLMDEKANTLVKKYKTNADILHKRIEQLSKRNKQLEKEMNLVKMYKDTQFL